MPEVADVLIIKPVCLNNVVPGIKGILKLDYRRTWTITVTIPQRYPLIRRWLDTCKIYTTLGTCNHKMAISGCFIGCAVAWVYVRITLAKFAMLIIQIMLTKSAVRPLCNIVGPYGIIRVVSSANKSLRCGIPQNVSKPSLRIILKFFITGQVAADRSQKTEVRSQNRATPKNLSTRRNLPGGCLFCRSGFQPRQSAW